MAHDAPADAAGALSLGDQVWRTDHLSTLFGYSCRMTPDLHQNDQGKPAFAKAYSFGLVTATFFLFAWIGQFLTQMAVERNEAHQHGQAFHWADFWPQFLASTFENWQSEFLQLVWQAMGLAILLFWGSSQSKESDERLEAKIDALLQERGIDHLAINREVNGSL